jgi:phosphoribosyl-AMP cyclohydrolase / phosphoribosyl-ATP pyrophosphohydrolase
MKEKIDWSKTQGLIPAIIQKEATQDILMLGYMNQQSFEQTLESGKVTFFSRSKNRLWVKGETSGNYLNVKSWKVDCDGDTLLFQVEPQGPTCHTGDETCFGAAPSKKSLHFLGDLENIIAHRWKKAATDNSYVASLAASGLDRITQKVGEEAIETVIAAKNNDIEEFKNEAADLLFHLLVLFRQKEISFAEVVNILVARNQKATKTEKPSPN